MPNGAQEARGHGERSRWERRRTWGVLRQQAHLETREAIQSKRNVKEISELWFVATEVEYCTRQR